jgi:hypothetical protein
MNEPAMVRPMLIMLVAALIFTLFYYWAFICRTLYRLGARFPNCILPWRVVRNLRMYREYRAYHGYSLTPYYIALILCWFLVLMAVATVLRHFWEHSKLIR